MPAYWTISFELEKSETLVREFYGCLAENGAAFLRGVRDSEGSTREEALARQERCLLNPWIGENKYYQDLFRFRDFSEVRGYWTYGMTALYHLIIPEDDFLYVDSGIDPASEQYRNTGAMDAVRDLARRVWEMPDVLIIQTGWECSDGPLWESELIERGLPPQAEPFAIVENSADLFSPDLFRSDRLSVTAVGRNGLLVENSRNWLFC